MKDLAGQDHDPVRSFLSQCVPKQEENHNKVNTHADMKPDIK
jgi:hypothetical protein